MSQCYIPSLYVVHSKALLILAKHNGRELRRYCRRWKIERLFAQLHNFRRLVTRWEYYEANFLAMLQLGCLVILLRDLSDGFLPIYFG